MKRKISLALNGSQMDVTVDSHQSLLDVLRGPLRTTGTKEGCGEGECGACTVLVDGQAVNACLYPALEASGNEDYRIEVIEGAGHILAPAQTGCLDEFVSSEYVPEYLEILEEWISDR